MTHSTRLPRLAVAALGWSCLTAVATPARAEDPPPAAAAPAEGATPAEPLVKTTTIGMPHPDVSDEVMVGIMRAVNAGLKQNKRLELKDLDTRLADFAQEVPADQVESARQALKAGQDALTGGNVSVAVQKLEEAVSGLAKVLPYIKKQELADAMAALAVAQFEGGDKTSGRKDFVRLLVWRPDYVYDPDKLPAKFMSNFDDAAKEVSKLKLGTLKISSNPPGAQAYVDGKYYGVTPCAAEGLPAGEHFVTLKKEGYKKAVTPAVAPAKKDREVQVELDRNEKYLLVEEAITHLDKNLGSDVPDPEMDTFKQVLFVEQVVFVRAKPKTPSDLDVEVYLYDLRSHRRIAKLNQTVAKAQIESQLSPVAQNLYLNVTEADYQGEIAAPKDAPPPKQFTRTPLYKTWWFWTAAGVVVLGAAGTGIAIAASRKPSCQDNSLCPTISF